VLELTQRARTAAGAIAFDTFGEGPPVVLVHGTPSRALVWRNVVPELARSRRVFVFDMLGFGGSERHLDQDVACFYEADTRAFEPLCRRWRCPCWCFGANTMPGLRSRPVRASPS
jgi:pimeloyl-ACP methyl ester carboxylesterase